MTCGECGMGVEACQCHVIDGGRFELGNHTIELGKAEQSTVRACYINKAPQHIEQQANRSQDIKWLAAMTNQAGTTE